MKKNLTFLMMLMAFVGIAFAQSGPKFNYTAVLRHADTLYHDQSVNVTITVNGIDNVTLYSETHTGVKTDTNGFISVVIGEGTPVTSATTADNNNDIKLVDWSHATIVAEFTLTAVNTTLTSTMEVKPVPYALQAGVTPLTTERIEAYMQNVLGDPTMLTKDGAKQVLNAFVNNVNDLEEALEDAIEDSLKSPRGYDIAFNILLAYMQQLRDANAQVGEAEDYYNAVKDNPVITEEMKILVKEFVKNPANREMVKNWVKPIAIYCLEHTTKQDVKDFYQALQQIDPNEKQNIKLAIKDYVNAFMEDPDNHLRNLIKIYLTPITNDVNRFVSSISYNDAIYAWGWLEMKRDNDPEDLKSVIRNNVDRYIQKYINTKLDTRVANAIDANDNNLIEIPECDGTAIDPCELWNQYKEWAE